jgi:hypothetical protein
MTEDTKDFSAYKDIIAGLLAEVLFAVLPLVVVFMVLMHVEHSKMIFSSPEWSFGASILFGQSLIKFISGIARGGSANGPVALACMLIIVFGLVPSLIILIMTLLAQEAKQEAACWLQYAQVAIFALGAIAYTVLGLLGEVWRRR